MYRVMRVRDEVKAAHPRPDVSCQPHKLVDGAVGVDGAGEEGGHALAADADAVVEDGAERKPRGGVHLRTGKGDGGEGGGERVCRRRWRKVWRR